MKEAFLHYLWKFKKFDLTNLKTTNNQPIVIINVGQYLQLAGPDFFNAQVSIANQKWAGNVEIHLKSSDWYLHHHEKDTAYDNVILHVVWQHDTEIFRKNNTEIPVLELKNYVSSETIKNYQVLLQPKSWIYCEKQMATIDTFILKNWQERLFFERLERKSKTIQQLLDEANQDWEVVLFCLLAKNFGLNTNGLAFMKIAQSIPFAVLRKESFDLQNLEALLLGSAGLLNDDKQDRYFNDLKLRFQYLMHKYQFDYNCNVSVSFFKHRPDNFPTIRLVQLAQLYHSQQQLFQTIINIDSAQKAYEVFNIAASDYWQTHYVFDKASPKKTKKLSQSFLDLMFINTIVPIQFTYAQTQGKSITDKNIAMLDGIAAENNAVIQKFASFGVTAISAFESQALLQLKSEYCDYGKCLSCAIGMELLKSN